MQIEHIAIWTSDLERMKEFYETYFQAKVGSKYRNPAKQFESYFLSFSSRTRVELMTMPGIQKARGYSSAQYHGYTHISFSTGSEVGVDELTKQLQQDGFQVVDGPRHTGDGYYESVVLDPDGNRVEISV